MKLLLKDFIEKNSFKKDNEKKDIAILFFENYELIVHYYYKENIKSILKEELESEIMEVVEEEDCFEVWIIKENNLLEEERRERIASN